MGLAMNIQIFGRAKCFDTRKSVRYFKERGIKYQLVDVDKYGISRGEFNSIARAVGGWENMLNTESGDQDLLALIRYLALEDKQEKLMENPKLLKTPIVRNGREAAVGYCPDVWKLWS